MIVIPTLTFGGLATALLMENIPGGDLEDLASLSYEKDPKHFRQTVLAKLEKHHPSTYNRIDTQRFDLMQPQDFLQGGVVPTVRNTVVELDDGKCAIALGDVHSVVDPLMGQGANVASYAAFVLGEEIVKADALGANTAALGRRGAKMAIEEIAAIFLLRQRSEGRSSEGRVAPGRDRSKVSKRYGMSCGQDGQVFRG